MKLFEILKTGFVALTANLVLSAIHNCLLSVLLTPNNNATPSVDVKLPPPV
jgi:hypothetical protein